MICSVVLRPTDPLDNASTEVSNLTLPQNSPALFVRRDPSIRFLDYDCEIIPYFSRNVSKEKKLRTEKKKKKKLRRILDSPPPQSDKQVSQLGRGTTVVFRARGYCFFQSRGSVTGWPLARSSKYLAAIHRVHALPTLDHSFPSFSLPSPSRTSFSPS